jgi:hypothetical protein
MDLKVLMKAAQSFSEAENQSIQLPCASGLEKLKTVLPGADDAEKIATVLDSIRTELQKQIRLVGEEIREEVKETYLIVKKEQRTQLLYQWIAIISCVVLYLVKTYLK